MSGLTGADKGRLTTVVVKFGTANLFGQAESSPTQDSFKDYARQIEEIEKKGVRIVVVSSGGIASGTERMRALGINDPASVFSKKQLAGIGSRHLLNKWGDAFAAYGRDVGQLWITFHNLENQVERTNIRLSIEDFLNKRIVPIINENDVISDTEIFFMESRISENDFIARTIAFLVKADGILLLTDEGGVYESDPKANTNARLFEEIDAEYPPADLSRDAAANMGVGRGGISTKLDAAIACANKGMQAAIAGREQDVIIKFIKGESVGTRVKLGGTNKYRKS